MATHSISPFLHPTLTTQPDKLAVLHLRRDQQLPILIQTLDSGSDTRHNNTTAGYAEGVVTNTRFGSYPHSTLAGKPWGSQIVATSVNTGARGKGKQAKKRIIDEVDGQLPTASGFCHLLPPTPESWTTSLPHRTQIVYTPDYSFVLQRLRARPGCTVIEAGAGSGSFTHAAARSVFSGYPPREEMERLGGAGKSPVYGRVYSFEYHEPRAQALQQEIREHGLDSFVTVTHRDVYSHGFMLPSLAVESQPKQASVEDSYNSVHRLLTRSPEATQVFLDLPAPWNAIPHLKRGTSSPLNPLTAVHLCCFLPCIEQVQRAVAALKQHDWVEISTYNLAYKRMEVRREKVGLEWEGMRGVNASPATVEESISRLKDVREREKEYRADCIAISKGEKRSRESKPDFQQRESKAERLERVKREASSSKVFMKGYLASRPEPDIKTHTSYLIFATLPVEWSE